MENLKTLKQATAQQVNEIAKNEYPTSEKMQNFLISKYDYYFTSDGYILEFEKASSLSINKTIWFDDETAAPDASLFNFIEHNKKNCNRFDCYEDELKHLTKLFACKQSNTCIYIDYDRYTNDFKSVNYAIRELTADEIYDILTIYKTQKEQYTERLTKYFTRYGKKISVCGYWANR